MELELGLKITRDDDDHNSTDFHIAKDRAGPVFVSTETDSVFILSAHLKGFEKENIKISINEDGKRLTISGEKLVRETIMKEWRVYKKEEEVRGFRKTFKIPDGVDLDRIKAKFGVEKFSLTIYMPKSEKGIHGHGIEEVKQEEEGEREATRPEEIQPITGHEKEHRDEQVGKVDKDAEMPPLKRLEKQPNETQGETKATIEAEEAKPRSDAQGSITSEKPTPTGQGLQEHTNGKSVPNQIERAENSTQKEVEKKPGLFAPRIFMGSALIASLVVLVVGLVRTKRQ